MELQRIRHVNLLELALLVQAFCTGLHRRKYIQLLVLDTECNQAYAGDLFRNNLMCHI